MKKLLFTFSLILAIGLAYGQEKVQDSPAAIAKVSGEDLVRPPSGSFSEILRSLQPTVSVGPSWVTGKDSGYDWEYKSSPRFEIVVGAYRDFIFTEEFNRHWRTRAGIRLRFAGAFEKWKYDSGSGSVIEGKDKINWGYIEAPAEISRKFKFLDRNAFAGLGLSPGLKLYANWKDEDGNKDKLEEVISVNLFITPMVGWQVCEHSEIDISYDFGIESWGGSSTDKKHYFNSVRFAYVHKFY